MRVEILSFSLFLAVSSLLFKMILSFMKPFEKSVTGRGEELCAVGSPSLVLAFDLLMYLPPDSDCCVAPVAHCAWQCGRDSSCTNYNYRTAPKRCDFFYYTPGQCKVVHGCTHVEASNTRKKLSVGIFKEYHFFGYVFWQPVRWAANTQMFGIFVVGVVLHQWRGLSPGN